MVAGESNRRASVSTCIAYADDNEVRTFVGTIRGQLAWESRGDNGFGYDPIFIPDGQDRTYAEMTSDEKNSHSMRSEALAQFKDFLASK